MPFTWISTAEVIALLGATPVFVDIEPDTYNIDVTKIEAAITSRTKAIMPVNLYGQMPDYDVINAIAAKYGIPVIEDTAARALDPPNVAKEAALLVRLVLPASTC